MSEASHCLEATGGSCPVAGGEELPAVQTSHSWDPCNSEGPETCAAGGCAPKPRFPSGVLHAMLGGVATWGTNWVIS